jgi:hypothetical protein
MSYEKWSAVCPRCSTQNTSENDPCSNCGNGPVLFQEYRRRAYQWDIPRAFQCRRCGTTFNDMRCRKCDTLIGGVTSSKAFPLGMFVFLGVVAVTIFGGLGSWLTSSNGSSSGQHSTEKTFGPSAHRPFPPGSLPSEGDIRSVMQAFTDGWNRSDVTAIRSLWCSRSVPDATILSKQIGWYGHIETSVTDIGGSGGQASAEITVTHVGPRSQGGEKEPWFFVNEGGSWKPCSVSFIWTQSYGH